MSILINCVKTVSFKKNEYCFSQEIIFLCWNCQGILSTTEVHHDSFLGDLHSWNASRGVQQVDDYASGARWLAQIISSSADLQERFSILLQTSRGRNLSPPVILATFREIPILCVSGNHRRQVVFTSYCIM